MKRAELDVIRLSVKETLDDKTDLMIEEMTSNINNWIIER